MPVIAIYAIKGCEYLKELHKRYKWKNPKRPVEVNDIVVIKQDNLPSNEWLLGRVIKTHPGFDGLPRVVVLRTSIGTLTRPITKVVVSYPHNNPTHSNNLPYCTLVTHPLLIRTPRLYLNSI